MRFAFLSLFLCLLGLVYQSSSQKFYAFGPYEYHVRAIQYGSGAERKCHSLNATLVTIKSSSVRNFLVDLIGNVTGNIHLQYTIGLYRVGRSTDFVWIDGTPLNYSDWFRNEPNGQNSSEDCVELRYSKDLNFAWNDVSCDGALGYLLCQRPAAQPCQTVPFNCKNDVETTVQTSSAPISNKKESSTGSADENAPVRVDKHDLCDKFYIMVGLASLNLVWIAIIIVLLVKMKNKASQRNAPHTEYVEVNSIMVSGANGSRTAATFSSSQHDKPSQSIYANDERQREIIKRNDHIYHSAF